MAFRKRFKKRSKGRYRAKRSRSSRPRKRIGIRL